MRSLPYKKSFVITQTFLNKNAYYSSGYHLAVDLVGLDDKAVYAIQDGIVTYAGYQKGFGNTVVIKQTDGLYCRYSHLSDRYVHLDEMVIGGQTIIGLEGTTGNVYGNPDTRHLDLRISSVPYHTNKLGAYINPSEYLGFPNKKNYIVDTGEVNMTERENIILCESKVDERAAGYLADYLNCAVIEYDLLPAAVIDQAFQNVYVIGSPNKPVPRAISIFGDDRFDTCQKVLDVISNNRF